MHAYEQMTQDEREKYNALVARLDELLEVKRQIDRRQEQAPIEFTDRRRTDRRRDKLYITNNRGKPP